MSPVRIGVLGAGYFGTLHALSVNSLSELQLCAIVDSSPNSLAQLPNSLKDIPRFPELTAALDSTDVEAWIVASSTASHVPLAQQLLKADAFVLLEKPIAPSLAEAESLLALDKSQLARLMLGHILLFNSEFRELQYQCQQRGGFDYASCYRMRPTSHATHYRNENPFFLTMVHDLYCVQSLVKAEEPQKFQAQRHCNTDGVMDLGLAQLCWQNGQIATFAAGFMTPNSMSHEGFDRMEIYGTGWMGRISPNPRPFELWDQSFNPPMTLEMQTHSPPFTGMLTQELRCFCRVVRGEESIPIGARYADGIQVLRWIDRLVKISQNN
jgi:predicted dehydrogenase